jgi:hypothetical protein
MTGSRTPAIAEVYAESLHFVDPHQEFTGREHFDGFHQSLHQKFPGAVFRLARPADIHHHITRLNWEFGPPANPTAMTGQDIIALVDGQIQALYVFIDGAARPITK